MDDRQKTRKPSSKPGTKLKKNAQPGKPCTHVSDTCFGPKKVSAPSRSGVLNELTQEAAGRLLRLAAKAGGPSLKIGKALLRKPEQRMIFREAELSLEDLRILAGMTQNEVSHALKVKDASLLKAVEDWVATFSIELILRITGLYSRDDLIPFIKKYTRTYSPGIWKLLDDWGIGHFQLTIERKPEFVNTRRKHDRVKKLSDEAFEKLSTFTRTAVEKTPPLLSKKENSLTGR